MKRTSRIMASFLLLVCLSHAATLTVSVEPANVGIHSVTPSAGVYEYQPGQTVNLAASSFIQCPSVYRFNHWTGDVANPDAAVTTVLMDADKTITAVFTLAAPVCGDQCHPNFTTGDLNHDCIVDLGDFAVLASRWMNCTKPECDEVSPPADTEPPLPNPTTLTVNKVVIGAQWYHVLTADMVTDTSGVEYQFECVSNAALMATAVHVDWINTENMVDNIYLFGAAWYPNGAAKIPNKIWIPVPTSSFSAVYRVRTRDLSPAQNTGQWSLAVNSEGQIIELDLNPPLPNPAMWQFLGEPYQNSPFTIRMAAQAAVDPEGNGVSYLFSCIEDPSLNSGWISSNEYVTPATLIMGQTYTFTVKYRDNSVGQNQTAASNAVAVTINEPMDFNPPLATVPLLTGIRIALGGQSYHVLIATTSDGSVIVDPEGNGEEYQFVCDTTPALITASVNVDWINSANMLNGIYQFGQAWYPNGIMKVPYKIFIPIYGTQSQIYRVRVRDQSPAQNTSQWSLPVTVQ